jgi:glycosyltransferase involved in cell wall biosynthesis
MKIAISTVNIQTGFDFRYVNRLIECFGDLAADRDFLLVGRKGQEDFIIPAPKNFKYGFFRIHYPKSDTVDPIIDKKLDKILVDSDCDLLLEFGLGEAFDIDCPKISLVNSFNMYDSNIKKNKTSSSVKRLKLVSRAATRNMEKSQGIIFTSRNLQDVVSRIMPVADLKTASIYIDKQDISETDNRKILSEYGINSRFLISLVSSEGMKEFSRILKAYCRAFERSPDIPDLVLTGTNESPEHVCEILNAIDRTPLHSKIKYIGTIPEEDFLTLLSEALILVFSSGIFNGPETLVAAMNRGCAIVCANDKIPLEVTDGAALYYDSRDWRDLAFKLSLIVDDEDLFAFLKDRSRERANFFSWEKATKQMLDFFDDVVTSHKKESNPETSKNAITY